MDMVGKGIPDLRNQPSLSCVPQELGVGGEKVLRVQLGLARPTPSFQPVLPSQRPTHPTPTLMWVVTQEVELKRELFPGGKSRKTWGL